MDNQLNPDSVNDEIRLSFALTRRDVLAYNLHFNRGLVFLTLFLFLLLLPSLIIALKYPTGDIGTFYMWITIGIGIAFVITFSSLLAIYIQVYYIKNEVVEKSMEFRNYIINSSGIAIFTANSRFTRTWKEIIKIIKTKNGYYLKTSDKAAVIIPFHVIQSEAERNVLKRIINTARISK